MNEEIIQQIGALIEQMEVSDQRRILLEAASRVGTEEWAEEVRELIRRMDGL